LAVRGSAYFRVQSRRSLGDTEEKRKIFGITDSPVDIRNSTPGIKL
jgi:hypothetical protein